jgi:hypothetical protein
VQINIVWYFATGVIVEVKLHHISLFDADKFPRDAATKGPEDIVHTIGESLDYLSHFKMNDDFGGMVPCDGWGNQGRIRQYRRFLSYDLSTCGWCLTRLRALCSGGGFPDHKPYEPNEPKAEDASYAAAVPSESILSHRIFLCMLGAVD